MKFTKILKENKWYIINGLIIIAAFIFILIMNLHTDYTSDDFKYHFVYDTPGTPHDGTKPISNPIDIIISMINHRKMCNARIVAHGLLQAVLPFGKLAFRLFNSAIYVALGFLIYKHAAYGKGEKPALLVMIYVAMWFYLPQFGLTVLWASGAANYLWCAALILLFLLPYRMYLQKGETKDSIAKAVLMGLFGILAGCTNENTGGGAVLMACLFIAICFIKKSKIPKWMWTGTIGGILGVILLITAPINYRFSTELTWELLRGRMQEVFAISKGLTMTLFVVGCFVAVVVIMQKLYTSRLTADMFTPLAYTLSSVAMMAVLVMSPMYPERAWFTPVVFLIISVAWLISEINLTEVRPILCIGLKTSIATIAIIVFIASFKTEYSALNSTYAQVKVGLELIEQAQENGDSAVTIPMLVPSQSKYDPYNTASYLGEGADLWVNAWMEEYYGIESISGEKQ